MITFAAAGAALRAVPVKVWLGLGIAVLAGLLVWQAYGWAYDRGVASRDTEVALLQTRIVTLESAAETNLQTIAVLKAKNKEWADAARVQEEQAADAVAAVTRERDALAKELEQRRKNRQVIYEQNPDAAVWGRTRIPDSVAYQLRE